VVVLAQWARGDGWFFVRIWYLRQGNIRVLVGRKRTRALKLSLAIAQLMFRITFQLGVSCRTKTLRGRDDARPTRFTLIISLACAKNVPYHEKSS